MRIRNTIGINTEVGDKKEKSLVKRNHVITPIVIVNIISFWNFLLAFPCLIYRIIAKQIHISRYVTSSIFIMDTYQENIVAIGPYMHSYTPCQVPNNVALAKHYKLVVAQEWG